MANTTGPNGSVGNFTDSDAGSLYETVEVVFIVIVAGSLSLVTIIGNILVMVSIKVNRHLQTINNYFIFSLACADLIIGIFSMNLYTIYIVMGSWPMGPVVCDLWLALDYVVSNASVMHLLVISFDRYFCVTKPLSYPVKRTNKMAGMMIAAAWVLSFILWAPAILFWQFIVGERNVPQGECHVQFLSNPVVTFGTAIAAFYLPVIIMAILYVHISRASKSRIQKDEREPEVNKGAAASPSLARGKLTKPNNNNNAPSPLGGLPQVKVQNGKAVGETVMENCGQGGEKEISNDSTSVSVAPSTQKEEAAVDEGTRVTSVPPPASSGRFRVDGSKFSCIKTESSEHCTESAVETAAANSDWSNGRERELAAARKIVTVTKTPAKKKKKGAVSRERKVTKTILAILLAFIITWTPYNVMVLINTFCSICVPNTVWTIGYWLCYINSTINPACYALCNATFKKTFKHLLLCQYKNIGATR
ncbi:muscarinic acetylcholine receptor M2-like [Leucoraja erinacea]|uniref:muscarinic acetylcholine receptor M2-like n=1 Tax=Leucoraja erinaceus TaxID=7782 RepID=UPI00245555C3|nr:muscarinic acetylcholine receptor M2-like [Leucoraja erinacea]